MEAYIVYFASLFRIGLGAGDSGEACKEPLSYSVDGVHGRFLCQPRPAGSNVKAQKVLHGSKVRSCDSRLEAAFSGGFFVRNRQSLLASLL
jgi:hypothetical protein